MKKDNIKTETVVDLAFTLSKLSYNNVINFNRPTQNSLGVILLTESNKILHYAKMSYKRKDSEAKICMLMECANSVEYLESTIDNLFKNHAISLNIYSLFSENIGKIEIGINNWMKFIKSKK